MRKLAWIVVCGLVCLVLMSWLDGTPIRMLDTFFMMMVCDNAWDLKELRK